MRLARIFTIATSLLLATVMQGQDIHFSQFGYTNLILNPGTTGVMTCNARVSMIYRNQWSSVMGKYAFNTFGFGAEAKFNAGSHDFVGAGLTVFADVAGASKFSTIHASISGAYLKKIGGRRSNDNFLVAGAQLGFVQRSLRLDGLRWGSNWGGTGFDPSLGSGEDFQSMGINGLNNLNFDLNAGLMWFSALGREGKSNVYVGIGFQHLTKANVTLRNQSSGVGVSPGSYTEALWTKYTIHGGGEWRFQKRMALVGSAAVWVQGPSTQLNGGVGLKFDFSRRSQSSQAFTVAVHTRASNMIETGFGADAIIPRLEMRFGSHRIGFAYDVNVSRLLAATRANGAFELGYVWTLCGKTGRKLGCPTF